MDPSEDEDEGDRSQDTDGQAGQVGVDQPADVHGAVADVTQTEGTLELKRK